MHNPLQEFVKQLIEADIMIMGDHAPYHKFTPIVKCDTIYIMPDDSNHTHDLSRDCYAEFEFHELRSLEYGGEGRWYGTVFNCITLSKTVGFE